MAYSVGIPGGGVHLYQTMTTELIGEATTPIRRAEKGGMAEVARKAEAAAAKEAKREAEEIDRAVSRQKPLYELHLDPGLQSEE